MVYEKKNVQPRETAYIQKAARAGYRGDPQKLVKRALAEQNERFKDKMSGKEDMIYRQQ